MQGEMFVSIHPFYHGVIAAILNEAAVALVLWVVWRNMPGMAGVLAK